MSANPIRSYKNRLQKDKGISRQGNCDKITAGVYYSGYTRQGVT